MVSRILGVGLIAAVAALAPPARTPTAKAVTLRASLYYVASEDDYPVGSDAAFRDAEGRPLYRASSAFIAAARIEGSAVTRSGAALSFDPENPQAGWEWSRSPYGVDAKGCALVPFRSAAVPPWMPLGLRLYIPETRGLLMPDGRRHDGYWYAADRGRGITGDRIDLFMNVGTASMRDGEQFGLEYLRPLHVRIVGRARGCPTA
jgi:3D (Asp-Asp-Asp) domain-containing protein